jgi:hypothetical protein
LTVIDGQENRKYNQRVKDTAIAKHKTKVEAQRLLDLQNRKKEIAVEEGF